MAKVILNANRNVKINVPVPQVVDGKEELVTFEATCAIFKVDEVKDIEELILGVSGLEITKEDGSVMNNAETLEFVKSDDVLAALTHQAYRMGNENTLAKSKTYLQQLNTSK